MALNPRSKTFRVLFAVVAVLVIYKMIFWFGDKPTTVPRAPLEVSEPAAEESLVAVEDGRPEEPEAVQPAKRIVHVPDTRKQPDQDSSEDAPLITVTAAKLAEFTAQTLDKALNGDLKTAAYLRHLRAACSTVPRNEATLEKEIENIWSMAKQSMEGGRTLPPEGRGYRTIKVPGHRIEMKMFPTESQNRAHLTQWYQGCRGIYGIFSDEMRRELELLARDGHVIARYVYAIWKPEVVLDREALEKTLNWQVNAIEFSYANLVDGEVAGVLAFGQSYLDVIFTSQDIVLGLTLLQASLDCGFESEDIQSTVSRMVEANPNDFLQLLAGVTTEEVMGLAAEMAHQCR